MLYQIFCFYILSDDTIAMNHIYRINLAPSGLLIVMLSTALLIAGCSTTTKKNKHNLPTQATVKQLSEPSIAYLSDANEAGSTYPRNLEAWLTIAQKNYDSKHYARALRAANEALSIDSERVDARQIAMLSAVKIMENNISAYHHDISMDDNDRAGFKETLTNITTLINTSN